MEYIEGNNIREYVEYQQFSEDKSLSLDDIFSQLIDGFCYIEEHGIIHRDIREGNILIDKTGMVKIIDFGIGKIFGQIPDIGDSLVKEINRAGSDTLPQEYYDGVYTSKTDMYYLGELLNRVFNDVIDSEMLHFSFQDIIDKMIEKRPQNRYQSFVEIREAIGKHDFINMRISEKDKKIYQEFTNPIYNSLTCFINEQKFNYDTSMFVTRLEKALRDNLFENIIQQNCDVISSLVIGGYRYKNSVDIQFFAVKNFLDWFKGTTNQSQKLILTNIILKLSSIIIKEEDPDMPF